MNPLTNMKNVTKLSERELHNNSKSSWHDQYRDSAWIFIGGLPYDLTEGDIICIFSQYGEVVNINLIRDKDNGKSKGFCFLCYEDQRSTVLAVDNFNGIKVLNRTLRVDHVSDYKIPKEGKKTDEETKKLYKEGCAPTPIVPVVRNPLMENLEYRRETLADQIQADIKLPARLPIHVIKKETDVEEPTNVKIKHIAKPKKKKKSHESSTSEDEYKAEKDVKNRKMIYPINNRSISESDSERGKGTHKKRRSQSQSPDRIKTFKLENKGKKIKAQAQPISRSGSPEIKTGKIRNRECEDIRGSKRRSRSREYNDRSSKRYSDPKRYDKHRGRSRS